VAIVIAVVLIAAGVGEVTGWVNLRVSPAGWSYTSESCGSSDVHAAGTVAAALGPAYAAWLESVAQSMASTVGRCFSLNLNPTSGDGYAPPLGAPGSEFAATYAPPTSAESQALPFPAVTVPVSLNAVAVAYNLPGVPSGLNLTPQALLGIYTGSITSWSSPAIADANPTIALSGLPAIEPYYESAVTSSNEVFSSFLSSSSPQWAATVGSGATVHWPVGTAVTSDATMLTSVEAVSGAIGYVEVYGAPPSGLTWANVEDAAGTFASPTDLDTWIAADSLGSSAAVATGNWSGFSLAGAAASNSYPLAALAYVSIYSDLGVAYGGALSLTNASWLLGYVYWLTAEVSVAPLPSAYETAAVNALNNETFDGGKIMQLENEQTEGSEGGETGEF